MAYYAKIRMKDSHSNDVYHDNGKAEDVIARSITYLRDKDGGILKRIANFVSEDFAVLAKSLENSGETLLKGLKIKK